jgi:hypothetical protein
LDNFVKNSLIRNKIRFEFEALFFEFIDLIKENHWNNFSNNFNDRNEQICNKTKYTKVFFSNYINKL